MIIVFLHQKKKKITISIPIKDVFSILERGTVAEGKIERGLIRVGEDIEINS